MWIYGRIISCKGIVCLAYLIRSIATHVRDKGWKKSIACITALLIRHIRKDHGLGIVRIERPSASTGFRPSASTGLFVARPSRPSASTGLFASRLHALI